MENVKARGGYEALGENDDLLIFFTYVFVILLVIFCLFKRGEYMQSLQDEAVSAYQSGYSIYLDGELVDSDIYSEALISNYELESVIHETKAISLRTGE